MTGSDALAALPFLALSIGALIIATLARLLRADERSWMLLAAIVAGAASMAAALLGDGPDGLGGLLRRDGASAFASVLVGASAATAALLEMDARSHDTQRAARPATLILLCGAGVSLMASAGDLSVAVVGVSLLSVSLHALAAPRHELMRGSPGSTRWRSVIAPLLFAAGSLLIFVDTGSTGIGALANTGASGQAGIALLVAALAVVIGLVPFHLVAPETDAGAPLPIVGYVTIVGKIGGFALLLRVAGLVTATGNAEADWRASLAVLAALTMTVGSLVSLVRSSLRRILAFIVIAQAGTIAIGYASGGSAGPAAAFALAALTILVVGVYAAITQVADGDPRLEDLRGLARRRPLLAVALGILMFGLAGVPPTAGFLARLSLFEAATAGQLAWLVAVGAVTTALSAICAFRVVLACLGDGAAAPSRQAGFASAVTVAAAILVLLIGLAPGPARDALQGVRF
jgi:NADH-quinone oxidoreductase subunit N